MAASARRLEFQPLATVQLVTPDRFANGDHVIRTPVKMVFALIFRLRLEFQELLAVHATLAGQVSFVRLQR